MRHPFSPGAMAVVLFALWGLPGVDPPARGALDGARASHVGRLYNTAQKPARSLVRCRERPAEKAVRYHRQPPIKQLRTVRAAEHFLQLHGKDHLLLVVAQCSGPPRGDRICGSRVSSCCRWHHSRSVHKAFSRWWDPGPASSGSRPVPGRASAPPWPAALPVFSAARSSQMALSQILSSTELRRVSSRGASQGDATPPEDRADRGTGAHPGSAERPPDHEMSQHQLPCCPDPCGGGIPMRVVQPLPLLRGQGLPC